MKITLQKPDSIGAIASMLCVVHCLLTPLIFIAHSCCKEGCDAAPTWWKSIDFIFLTISFISIYQSTKTTTQDAMKPILWSLWCLLSFLIINEKIILHIEYLYNRFNYYKIDIVYSNSSNGEVFTG